MVVYNLSISSSFDSRRHACTNVDLGSP